MPYVTDRESLSDVFIDKRTKLLPCQRERMRAMREDGASQRELARVFKVSRRLVQFVIDPSKQEENKKRRAESGGSKQYYDREKNTIAQREHRRRKYKILKSS